MPKEKIEAPLPGKVLRVEATPGQQVEEGGLLCIIESMKMENPILSPVGGKVVEVGVTLGQVVRSGQLIFVVEY